MLDNGEARITVEAERSFMRELKGDCHSLIGAYSEVTGDELYMIGIYDLNGVIVRKDITGKKSNHLEVGRKLAEKILNEK